MSLLHRHDVHEAPPRPRSAKRNPSHNTSRDFPGTDYSPGKARAHLNRKSNYDSDQSLLKMLNSTVACLKQKKMDLEALGCLEQSLWLKRRMFGANSSAVLKALHEVMLSYNSVAMQYLAQGQFDQCLAMLRKAEAIVAPGNFRRSQALQILTFNNIGCCYRKLGKLKLALKYLKEAAQIGSGSAHVKNLSITHLNLCAIQSQLGRHDLALEHAQAAIFHTQEELVSLEGGARDEDDRDQDALDAKTREEKIISLAVAYHNLAVELEFNGRGEASLQWYKKALQLVWKYRETNEALCESFKKIFLDAKKKQKTANIRQNGIPASAFTANKGRRPLTRPKSAHASRSTNDIDRGDVSYSSTVASHCYKATKPSTAGLRYGTAATESGKTMRPTSATMRQRPVSAKPSTRPDPRDSEDTFELHWRRLEKEHDLNDVQPPPEKKTRRPQSASSASTAARRNQTQRQHKLQGQLFFGAQDEDFIGNDEDYGVINDDASDDEFDNYPGNNQQEGEVDSKKRCGRPGNSRKERSSATGGSRHRRVLDISRSQTSLGPSETISDIVLEEGSPSGTHTGYNGDDDTDQDLPAQRVCHMEYLRRMKKLADSIKEDMSGAGIRLKDRIDPAENENAAKVSTPRSSTSKLRDQIEQARRDSSDSLHDVELHAAKPTEVKAVKQKLEDDELELQEDVHVFESEVAARDAELQLFREAAGRRLQAFLRGQRCRFEVQQLKQIKLENASACLIQRQTRQYYEAQKAVRRLDEEKLQLELQREEVEDMAACLIQRLWRRALNQNIDATESQDADEDEKPSQVPQRRVFSIADVVLGAAVKKSVGPSSQRPPEPPPLNPAVSVPHLNFSNLAEPKPPRRSSTVSSIRLADPNEVELSTKSQGKQSARSDVYDDDEEWKESQPRSAKSTPSTTRNSQDNGPATSRTSRSTADQLQTPKQQSTAVTQHLNRNIVEEADIHRQNGTATRIQACFRSFAVRRRIALENASDLSRAYIEQRHFILTLDQAMVLEQDFLEELSAIKIQALVRGRQSRLLTECTKAGVYTAAITIQRSFRVHRQNTRRAVDEGVRSIAARTIQQVFRDYEARRAAVHQAAVNEELLSVQQIAANTIQSFWRQYFTAFDHNLEEIEAATCIQALSRGHLTRKSLKSLRGSSSGFSKHSSAFLMSSVENLIEGDDSASGRKETLSINCSFLPPKIRELYMSSGNQVQSSDNEIQAQEIAELGLTFADFLRELETGTDEAVAISALDAMRVLLETSPESTKTLANVVKVAQALDRRLRDGVWNEGIETSSMALLHAFRDVLDAQ